MQHRTWVALVAALSFGIPSAIAAGTASAGWLPAQTLGVGDPGPWYGVVPQVAMNPRGDAAVLTGPETDPLALATRAAGADAFSPVSLPSPFNTPIAFGSFTLGADGTVVVGLHDDDGMHVASGPLAGPIGPPATVAAEPWPDSTGPHVAMADDGTVIAVWGTPSGTDGNNTVRWAVKPPGSMWGQVRGSVAGPYAQFGNLSVSHDGHALITYNVYDDGVYAVSRAPGGEFGTPERVSAGADVDVWPPSGTIAPGGAAVVAFGSGDENVLVQRASASAAWGSPTTVATGRTTVRRLVTGDDGDFLMTYQTTADRAFLLTGQIGGALGAPHDLGLGTTPALAVAGDGTAAAVWATFDDRRLWATRRPPGGEWTTPRTIDDPGDTTQLVSGLGPAATLAADADGDFVAGWVADSGNYRVRSFDPAAPDVDPGPPAFDAISIPATAKAGRDVSFSARAHGESPVTVTWDFGDGATATGTDVQHAFTHPGSFTVKVTATDAGGAATSTTRTLAVTQDEPAHGWPPPHHGSPHGWPPRPRCVVPSLRRHTLAGARTMLRRAHCALGRATTPRQLRHRKGLLVRSQSRRPRTVASHGAKVNIMLSAEPKRGKRPTR
jgi:hypothetical protein